MFLCMPRHSGTQWTNTYETAQRLLSRVGRSAPLDMEKAFKNSLRDNGHTARISISTAVRTYDATTLAMIKLPELQQRKRRTTPFQQRGWTPFIHAITF